jgi:hypothetical protein
MKRDAQRFLICVVWGTLADHTPRGDDDAALR